MDMNIEKGVRRFVRENEKELRGYSDEELKVRYGTMFYPIVKDELERSVETQFAVEYYSCNKCNHWPVVSHVKLPNIPVGRKLVTCPKCGATGDNLTFQKVYRADSAGRITE